MNEFNSITLINFPTSLSFVNPEQMKDEGVVIRGNAQSRVVIRSRMILWFTQKPKSNEIGIDSRIKNAVFALFDEYVSRINPLVIRKYSLNHIYGGII